LCFIVEKIKAGLIHNAKIKQQYAKMLKREGLGGGDANMDAEDDRAEAADQPMEGQDTFLVPSKRKGKGRMRNPDDMEQDGPSPTKPVLRKRKSSELERDTERDPDAMQSDDDDEGPAPGPDVSSSSTYVHPTRRDVASEPVRKRQRISEEELDEKREKRKRDRLAWGKKTRKGQPNLVRRVNDLSLCMRAELMQRVIQGSRMNVLLGKIERNVSQ
jgi:hypothetical protein